MMSGNNGMNGSGMAGFLGGLFGDSGSPYSAAMGPYQQWNQQAAGAQNPFYNAGSGAIPKYNEWLQGMSDPASFMNKMMGQYQQSPWAKFSQQQGIRAANNLGSATGLTGSTPLQMQGQQNAQNISSQDMQNWLQNAIGINTQYGAGLNNEMGMGANSANALTGLYGNEANGMGQLAYGQKMGENQDQGNMWGGLLQMLMHGIGS